MIRVVLIDRHSFFRRALRRRLEHFGLAVIAGESESGQDAIALIDSISPDLILMDIELPGIDGIELGRRVKQKYPDITVALYTLLETATLDESLYGSADYCLNKEVLFDSLIDIINKIEMKKRLSKQGIQPV